MKIVTNRVVVDLRNDSPADAKAKYDDIVNGDSDAYVNNSFAETDGFHSIDGEKMYYVADEDAFYHVDDYFGVDGDYSNVTAKAQARKDARKTKDNPEGKTKIGLAIKSIKTKITEFIGKRKAKKEARKLKRLNAKGQVVAPTGKTSSTGTSDSTKGGKQTAGTSNPNLLLNLTALKYIDVIPPVTKKTTPNGVNYTKPLPDGNTTIVSESDLVKGKDGKTYDKKDLPTGSEQKIITDENTGEQKLGVVIDQKDVETLQTFDNDFMDFNKKDVIDKGADEKTTDNPDDKGSMSKGLKIGLIIGGVVIVGGLIAYLIYRASKGSNGAAVSKGGYHYEKIN